MPPNTAAANGGPRWRVETIRVCAFKSFSGNASVFRLRTSDALTCIQGPNGAGKSALLEALAFALGAAAPSMRVRTLRDVVSTESGSQLCEVRVQLSRQGASSCEVAATLSPEGTRVFKVDGRVRSAAQVKSLLRAGGIVVSDATVIRQAQVTALADSNDPTALAELVASASGLARWREESKAAAEEVRRAHRALAAVRRDLVGLRSAVAGDEALATEARRAATLTTEASNLLAATRRAVERRRGFLQLRVEQSARGAAEAAAEVAAAKDTACRSAADAARLAQELRDSEEAAANVLGDREAGPGEDGLDSDDPATATIEAAEQRAQGFAAEAAVVAEQAAAVRAASDALKEAERVVEAARARAATVAQRRAELEGIVRAAAATGEGRLEALEAQHADCDARLQAARAAARVQREALAPADASLQQARATAASARQLAERAQQELEVSAGAAETSAAANDPVEITAALQEAETVMLAARRAAMAARADASAAVSAAVAAGPQGGGAALLAAVRDSCPSACRWVDCLRFKTPANAPSVIAALAALCPTALDVILVPDAAAAAALLDAHRSNGSSGGGRVRIWQLDRLAVRDQQRSQREAQRVLGEAAQVQLAPDLFHFAPVHEAAVMRALGGLVIAQDDATAAAVVERFGLGAVTLAGTVHRRGTVSGGWDGPGSSASRAAAWWGAIAQRDATAAAAAAAEGAAASAVAQYTQLDQAAAAAEQAAAEHAALAQRVADTAATARRAEAQEEAAAAAVVAGQQALANVEGRERALIAGLQECRALLEEAAGAAGAAGATTGQQAGRIESIGKELARLNEASQEAEAAAEAAEAAEDKARAALEVERLRLSALPDAASLHAALQEAQQAVRDACRRAAEHAAAVAEAAATLQALRRRGEAARAAAQRDAMTLRRLERQEAEEKRRSAGAVADLEVLLKREDEMVRVWGEHDAWAQAATGHEGVEGDAAGSAGDGSDCSSELPPRVWQDLRRLRAQLDALPPPPPAGEAAAAAARAARVGSISTLCHDLESEIAALEADVARGAAAMAAANDAVAEEAAEGFAAIGAALLPSVELALERVGRHAHEGLVIKFRKRGAGADAEWASSLSSLSGGQRSVVSLAALLAAARAAGRGVDGGSALYIMDEADAALDESNQRRVAELLLQMGRNGPAQVIAVSHNPAFQRVCDGVLHVNPPGAKPPTSSTTAGAAGHGMGEASAAGKASLQGGGKRQRRTKFAVA